MENTDVDIERNLAVLKKEIQPDPRFVAQLKEKLEQFPLIKYRQDKTKRLLLFIAIGFVAILVYIAGHNILDASEDK